MMSSEPELLQEENNEEVYERLTFMVDKGQEPMRIDKWVQMRIEGMTEINCKMELMLVF